MLSEHLGTQKHMVMVHFHQSFHKCHFSLTPSELLNSEISPIVSSTKHTDHANLYTQETQFNLVLVSFWLLTMSNNIYNIIDRLQCHIKYTGTCQRLEYEEKVISKSETFIYFRLITCKVKHFKSFFVLIWMIRAYSSWKSKISISK